MEQNRLKQLRENAKINQKDFAKMFNVARQSVANWECDISTMKVDIAIKVAEYFHVTVDYLLGVDDGTHLKNIVKAAVKKLDKDMLAEIISDQAIK